MYLYRQAPRVVVVTNSLTLLIPKEVTSRLYIPRTVRRIQWIQTSVTLIHNTMRDIALPSLSILHVFPLTLAVYWTIFVAWNHFTFSPIRLCFIKSVQLINNVFPITWTMFVIETYFKHPVQEKNMNKYEKYNISVTFAHFCLAKDRLCALTL